MKDNKKDNELGKDMSPDQTTEKTEKDPRDLADEQLQGIAGGLVGSSKIF